jgi:hypothetical protein
MTIIFVLLFFLSVRMSVINIRQTIKTHKNVFVDSHDVKVEYLIRQKIALETEGMPPQTKFRCHKWQNRGFYPKPTKFALLATTLELIFLLPTKTQINAIYCY